MHEFDRTIRLVGEEGQARLLRAKVALFGVGGVGSWMPWKRWRAPASAKCCWWMAPMWWKKPT